MKWYPPPPSRRRGPCMFSHLITHSGAFHADELFATSVLRVLAPEAPLIRTRCSETIAALRDAGGIVYDIGHTYDHAQRIYDHHQENPSLRPLQTNVAVPYSAFGLIWMHYGDAYLKTLFPDMDDAARAKTAQRIDSQFVSRIDMGDNGVFPSTEEGLQHPMSISKVLETFNLAFDSPAAEEDAAFLRALDVAGAILHARASTTYAEMRSQQVARRAIRARTDPRVVVLPQGMPYMNALKALRADDVLYVLMPNRTETEWMLVAVRQQNGKNGCRKPLPATWAGKRDHDLAALTGVADAIFCHNGRFLAAAKSLEGAKALLHLALKEPG